jgi:HSP90 family molecular chaperone
MDHIFQVDRRGLIELLSGHLYSEPSVFVRELLQNAVDAIAAHRPSTTPPSWPVGSSPNVPNWAAASMNQTAINT